MEYNENDTKLLVEAKGSAGETINQYSITNGNGLALSLQVSGEIQSYDYVEIGLYTMESFPLCEFGPFVITRIPMSQFLLKNGMIVVGVYHPIHQSKFAHVSYWTENNESKSVELNLKSTLDFWTKHMADIKEVSLKLMLSGYSQNAKKTFIRDIHVVNLIQ